MLFVTIQVLLSATYIRFSLFPAILYECVKCIYTIHPKSNLLEKAAKCIGNFVLSPKINLKYLGKRQRETRLYINNVSLLKI